jgi:exosortase C (VPDSG-CTERM-specific)
MGMSVETMERPGEPSTSGAMRRFWIWTGAVTLLFSPVLYFWARFALTDDLASYVLLIPFIAGSLIWRNRTSSPDPHATRGSKTHASAALSIAGLLGVWAIGAVGVGNTPATRYDFLAPAILAYIAVLAAGAYLFLGRPVVRHHAFALGFLAFAAPLPSWAVNGLEIFFQHTSAEVAAWMMQLANIPTLRTGLYFQLPGITIQVAQECSGIRSSLVLFIVSVYAGYVILQRPMRRWVLALFVIPLGIVRNGFRILTIAALCTHVGSHMIDSPIHHRGGPIFFALSLIPLFLLLLWLRRGERKPRGSIPSGGLAESKPLPPTIPGEKPAA